LPENPKEKENQRIAIQQNKIILKQNEVIISLLGRLAFTQKQIREIVEKNKAKDLKSKYVEGYNALDGSKTLSEIANIIGVKQGTLSPILTQWLEKGIIYEVEKTGGRYYKNLFLISGELSDK
jgi:DNA-binding MarR family transcriptional regulator